MTDPYPLGSPGVLESSMPTGAPGLMPRRSSYASVVSGTASATAQSYQQPARSGGLSHLLSQSHEPPFEANYNGIGGHSRYDSRGIDMDTQRNGGSYNSAGSWGRPGRLPSFSSAFLPFTNGHGYDGIGGQSDQFFVPSYLRGSRHVQKLEEAYKAKLAARKDAPSTQSSQPGSLSKSGSSANLHGKMAPSHRGMTYDLIEKANDEKLAPLPSRWNTQDKHAGLEVMQDGQEVKFVGSRPSGGGEHESSSIRTDYPIPPQCGVYYFEVTILSRKREETSVCIGFSSREVALSRPPGWEPESWGYHGDDGHSYCCHNTGKHYGPPYLAGDIIGCGVNFRTGIAFFTKNGDNLGPCFREVKGRLFPSVGMKKSGDHIRVNFGQSPFVFDIDGVMSPEIQIPIILLFTFGDTHAAVMDTLAYVSGREVVESILRHRTHEKQYIKQQVEATRTQKLAPPLDETSLVQSLILQYLSHDDYVETAKAFAQEVHAERQALNLDPQVTIGAFDFVREDQDATNRQRIRMAILDGDVDKALKHTNAYYPNVLKDNEHIYFHLRSRKFIEMIRRAAEIRALTMNGNKKSNSQGGDWYDDVINHEMELDDPPAHNGWDRMDTEGMNDSQADYNKLLAETITYGQVLQAEFEHDPRREIQKSLQDAFALLAYEDPINSKEVSHLLQREGRVAVAEELNSAILVSLGKSSCAALERVIQQTTVLIDDLRDNGGPGSFINFNEYLKPEGI